MREIVENSVDAVKNFPQKPLIDRVLRCLEQKVRKFDADAVFEKICMFNSG